MKVSKKDEVKEINIYDIKDFSIGHEQDYDALTGCTVIICENTQHAVSGADVRGGDAAVRNIEGIRPGNKVDFCNAIVLSGGSSFGLDAVGGVEQFLEERGIGDIMGVGDLVIPNVAGAILYDLATGSYKVRPGRDMAYRACENAYKNIKYRDGNIGAGTGATVGKIRTGIHGMKGGLGTYCIQKGDLYVGVIVAVNAIGDIVETQTSQILAGARDNEGKLVNAEDYILANFALDDWERGNTTIGAVITNAKLSKAQVQRISMLAHDGLARAIRPVHTMADGDTIFATATGEVEASMILLEVMTVTATERAIANAIKNADSVDGRPSYKEYYSI